MNITEIKNNDTELHVKITIPMEEISSNVEKELIDLSKKAKIDGFRVGKVPMSLLKKRYKTSLRGNIVQERIFKISNDLIKDRKLNHIGNPSVEDIVNEEKKDLEFILKYQLIPKLILPDFSKIFLEKPTLKLDEKNVEKELQKLVSDTKSYEKISKEKAKKGDQVTIDADGYTDNKLFEGGNLSSYKLVLGSGTFITGFEDQLIGAKSGEKVTVKVTFPKTYHEKALRGKDAEFKVNMLEVRNETPSKLDDNFAKKFNLNSVAELREQVRKNIHSSFELPINTLMKKELFDKLEELLNFSVPETLMKKEVAILKENFSTMEKEELEEENFANEEEKEKYIKKLALRRTRLGLMLAEYVDSRKIEIDKSDVQKSLVEQSLMFPGNESDVISFYLNNEEALESLRGNILENKVVETILEKEIKLIEKSYNIEELDKIIKADLSDYQTKTNDLKIIDDSNLEKTTQDKDKKGKNSKGQDKPQENA